MDRDGILKTAMAREATHGRGFECKCHRWKCPLRDTRFVLSYLRQRTADTQADTAGKLLQLDHEVWALLRCIFIVMHPCTQRLSHRTLEMMSSTAGPFTHFRAHQIKIKARGAREFRNTLWRKGVGWGSPATRSLLQFVAARTNHGRYWLKYVEGSWAWRMWLGAWC